jgi:hypothetical protein
MGTSSSNKGPRPGSPLIPPWADPLPEGPLPPDAHAAPPEGGAEPDAEDRGNYPATLNLTGFRRLLGNAVARGNSPSTGRQLRRALRRYASATGGGAAAARRLASPARSGGRVFALLGTGSAIGPTGRTITFASLDGQSVRTVVDRIVQALVPVDGDRDKVAAALQDALSTALNGAETFDQNAMTPDVLVNMMAIYLRDIVFQTIIADSGRAFQRTDNIEDISRMERAILALVGQVVDDQARPMLTQREPLSEAQVVEIQTRAIAEVWDVWEQSR